MTCWGPSNDFQGHSNDFRGHSFQFRSHSIYFQGHSNDFQSPSNDFQGPSNDFQGPSNDFRGPSNDFRGHSNDFRGHSNDFRGPSNDFQGHSNDFRSHSGRNGGRFWFLGGFCLLSGNGRFWDVIFGICPWNCKATIRGRAMHGRLQNLPSLPIQTLDSYTIDQKCEMIVANSRNLLIFKASTTLETRLRVVTALSDKPTVSVSAVFFLIATPSNSPRT